MKRAIILKFIGIIILNFTGIMANSQSKETTGHLFTQMKEMREILHKSPEYSHKEEKTAQILLGYIEPTKPDLLHKNIGGHGIVAGYRGRGDGPSVMFRCEMDAIKTEKGFEHLCGHDGHMSILLGLSQLLSQNREFNGTVWLLFQPAEEIGEGASMMAKELKELGVKFDYAFALHNHPGYPLNSVIIHKGVYAAGSVGMEIRFKGSPSHAAYPEQAISPLNAIIGTADYMKILNSDRDTFKDFILGTVVNITLGEINYGVTPGEGYLRMTLRSFADEDLDKLCSMMERFAKERGAIDKLEVNIAYFDRFPATVNDDKANSMVEAAAKSNGLEIIYAKEPTRGSDDFSFFAFDSISSFFDIGNGTATEDIHRSGYKFSDPIMETALNIYKTMILAHYW
ncbi:MAG: amidohydrolase [Bacteroidetes bacterium HGW-Bacteroidetes-8]|jgi:amidohydrolase|nr:MAG: amidohydrolase [Bacteroidetes bacterium HGW-Bacteroidetes-8]